MEDGEGKALQSSEINLIKPLQPFVKFLTWEKADAEYYMKNVRNRKVLSDEEENAAMFQILQSFVDSQPRVSRVENVHRLDLH